MPFEPAVEVCTYRAGSKGVALNFRRAGSGTNDMAMPRECRHPVHIGLENAIALGACLEERQSFPVARKIRE